MHGFCNKLAKRNNVIYSQTLRPTYIDVKKFRTISLTSFLLKRLGRLVNRYEWLRRYKQHTCQKDKSIEKALHELTAKIGDICKGIHFVHIHWYKRRLQLQLLYGRKHWIDLVLISRILIMFSKRWNGKHLTTYKHLLPLACGKIGPLEIEQHLWENIFSHNHRKRKMVAKWLQIFWENERNMYGRVSHGTKIRVGRFRKISWENDNYIASEIYRVLRSAKTQLCSATKQYSVNFHL